MKSGRLSIERIAIAVLASVIVALLVYLIFFNGSSTDKYADDKRRIDSLAQEIITLDKKHQEQDSVIESYHKQIDSIDVEVDNTNQKITKIKKQYGTKIDSVRNYTPTQLDSFFTNRYK